MKRPRATNVTFIIAGLWSVVCIVSATRHSPVIQLLALMLTLPLGIGCIISLIRAFVRWNSDGWRSCIPLAVCGCVIVLTVSVSEAVRHAVYRNALSRFESVISKMESGVIPVSEDLQRVKQVEGGAAYAVLAQRTNGVLTVEFLVRGGFPVKHSGYLYCSSGVIEHGSVAESRWPHRRSVKPGWFWISD